jgi:hypothetical protein
LPHPDQLEELVGFEMVACVIGPNCLERLNVKFEDLLVHPTLLKDPEGDHHGFCLFLDSGTAYL